MLKLSDITAIALARAEAPAIVSPEYSLSWGAFEATVSNLVAALPAQANLAGVRQAVYVSDNRVELVLLMSVFATLGIPLCGIDYTLDAPRTGGAIRAIGGDCLVLSSKLLGAEKTASLLADWGGPVIDLDDHLPGTVHMEALMLPCQATEADLETRYAQPFRAISFTSGTSGAPKPTVRTRSVDARRFHYFTTRYGLNAHDRYLLNMPLYHVAGSGWARHFLSLGATLYLVSIDRPEDMAATILSRGITAMVTTPVNLAGIVEALAARNPAARLSLRFVVVGGKNFSPVQKQRAIEVLGPVVYEYYGSTETGVNAIAEPADLMSHPTSVGRAYGGQRIVALDEAGAILPAGMSGRIAVSGFLLMDGYADAAANETCIDGQRYLITPDQGYLDRDGRLYVLNRASGAVQNVDVYAIEEQLRRLPGVRDVALVMDAAARDDQHTADCALTLASGTPLCDGLLQTVRSILSQRGVRHRTVKVIERIPYNLSGKIRWPDLAALLAGGSAVAA